MRYIAILFLAISSCGHVLSNNKGWNDHLNELEIKADKLTNQAMVMQEILDELRLEIEKLRIIADDEEERGER